MDNHEEKSHYKLAMQATTHCLIGCGLGDILGMMTGAFLALPFLASVWLGIILGFILGYSFGVLPLIKNMGIKTATKIVLTTETLSIMVMEIGEALTELHFPGLKKAGLMHLTYWLGLSSALSVGFLAAYPVNLFLVKRGVKHHH